MRIAKKRTCGEAQVELSTIASLRHQGGFMSEKFKTEMISRRAIFSALGLAVATSLAVPAAMITATDAEAAVGNPASAASVAGMNRRDRRRDRRSKRKKKK